MPPDLLSQFPLLEEGLRGAGRGRVRHGRVRGRRRHGGGRRRGRRRPRGRPGADLHARQGSRPVRARRPHRAARPAQGRGARRRRASGRSSAWPPSRSPTTSVSWATAPTASPAWPGGGPSRPRRCWPATATSRTSRPTAPTGTSTCAARPSWRSRSATSSTWPLLFRRIATVELDAPTIDSVDELEWRGPRPEAGRRLAERIDAPGLVDPGRQVGRAAGRLRPPGRGRGSDASRLRRWSRRGGSGSTGCRCRTRCALGGPLGLSFSSSSAASAARLL